MSPKASSKWDIYSESVLISRKGKSFVSSEDRFYKPGRFVTVSLQYLTLASTSAILTGETDLLSLGFFPGGAQILYSLIKSNCIVPNKQTCLGFTLHKKKIVQVALNNSCEIICAQIFLFKCTLINSYFSPPSSNLLLLQWLKHPPGACLNSPLHLRYFWPGPTLVPYHTLRVFRNELLLHKIILFLICMILFLCSVV